MTATDRRANGLLQMIELNDTKHEDAHKRLRTDLEDLETQHRSLSSSVTVLKDELAKQSSRIDVPPNVERMLMTPRVAIAIILFTVSVSGAIWSSTSSLRSDVRDILTRMEAQKSAVDSATKVQEVQSTSLRLAVDDVKRRQELQQYEIQALKEIIIGKGKS